MIATEPNVELVIVIMYTIVVVVYVVPSIVAFWRSHQHRWAILVLNIFLGWNLLGWVAAFVWALVNSQPNRKHA